MSALQHQPSGRRPRVLRAPRLRLLTPPAPTVARRGVFAAVIVGLVVTGMAVLLVLNTSLAQGAFDLQRLNARQSQLQVQAEALQEQVARAQSPVALKAQADRLGMVPVPVPAFLRLSDGKVLGVPTPATARRSTRTHRRAQQAPATDVPQRTGRGTTPPAVTGPAVTGPEGAEQQAPPSDPPAVAGPEAAEQDAGAGQQGDGAQPAGQPPATGQGDGASAG